MSLELRILHSQHTNLPRTCGDEPAVVEDRRELAGSAPHLRG